MSRSGRDNGQSWALSASERDQLMSELLTEHRRRSEANKPLLSRYVIPTFDELTPKQQREYQLSLLAWRDIGQHMAYLRRNIADLADKPQYVETREKQQTELSEYEALVNQLAAARDSNELTASEYEALVIPGHEQTPEVARLRGELRELRWFYEARRFMCYHDGWRWILRVRDRRSPARRGTVTLKRDSEGQWWQFLRWPDGEEGPVLSGDSQPGVAWDDVTDWHKLNELRGT